jgi:hypothetical protein
MGKSRNPCAPRGYAFSPSGLLDSRLWHAAANDATLDDLASGSSDFAAQQRVLESLTTSYGETLNVTEQPNERSADV